MLIVQLLRELLKRFKCRSKCSLNDELQDDEGSVTPELVSAMLGHALLKDKELAAIHRIVRKGTHRQAKYTEHRRQSVTLSPTPAAKAHKETMI